MATTKTLNSKDFRWDGYYWTAEIQLLCWRGFQRRRGSYGTKSSPAASDGTVTIVFAPEGRDDAALSATEIDLVRWTIEHAEAMQAAMLAKLVTYYAAQRPRYAEFLDEEYAQLMPEVTDAGGFKELIRLRSLNVHPLSKRGVPYVGLEFACTWDNEHGLGALMHGERVVELGGADTAILLWIAKRDAKKKKVKNPKKRQRG